MISIKICIRIDKMRGQDYITCVHLIDSVPSRFMRKIICRLLQFHGAQLGSHGLCLLAGRLFALLGVDRLEHFCHNFCLDLGTTEKILR